MAYEHELYDLKLSRCKSKKDYKRLCKKMIKHMEVTDGISEYTWGIMAKLIGEDNYAKVQALAISAYIAKARGYDVDIDSLDISKLEDASFDIFLD